MRPGLLVVVCFFNLFLVTYAQQDCPKAPSNPQDRRPDRNTLRIATYNAEWLFLNRSNCPGSGCPWPTEAAALMHMQDIATEIELLDADIVNLAEVQDCSVLTRLNEMLPGMGYLPYLLTGTDTSTGQNVALLTRVDPITDLQRTTNRVNYPIPGSTCGASNTGNTAVSKHYYTTFNVVGLPYPLTIYGMHFIAFPDDRLRCLQREGQASVIKAMVAASLAQGHSVVVLGDLNDYDGAVPDASDSIPISSVLDLLRNPVADKPGDELTNVASFVADESQRYSCWWDKDDSCTLEPDELTSIDHLLVSNDLAPLVSAAYMDHSYSAYCPTFQSDHWPVVVQLNLKKK